MWREIDRPSRLAAAAAVALTLVGVVALMLTRPSAVNDASTPKAAVTSYVQAVQAGDVDRAWELLAPAPGETQSIFSKDTFRDELRANRDSARPDVRIVNMRESVSAEREGAIVNLQMTRPSGNPFSGTSTQDEFLILNRLGHEWRIVSAPIPWAFV